MFSPKPKDGSEFRFPLQCIWLKINGSWPVNSRNWTFAPLYALWSWYVVISVLATIYFQTTFLVFTFGDILKTSENCSTTFMGLLNFIRLVHLKLHQKEFREILDDFVKNIWIPKGSNPEIEADCMRKMRKFRYMSVLLMSLILMYCFLPLVELVANPIAEDKPFPYQMIFFYDAQRGLVYVLTYIFTAMAGIFVVTTLFAEDSLFGFFVTYTCGQFKILHQEIGKLVPKSHRMLVAQYGENGVPECAFQEECNRRLHLIVKKHCRIIAFADRLEAFNGPVLFTNFTFSSILICMVGFQLVTGEMFIGDYIKFLVYILSALSQLFILCWTGDTLIQSSVETAWHLSSCNWEGGMISNLDGNENIRRPIKFCPTGRVFNLKLKLMIMRSQKPVQVTALKFSVLSLQSFSKILSSSMSYFTLLQTMWKK